MFLTSDLKNPSRHVGLQTCCSIATVIIKPFYTTFPFIGKLKLKSPFRSHSTTKLKNYFSALSLKIVLWPAANYFFIALQKFKSKAQKNNKRSSLYGW